MVSDNRYFSTMCCLAVILVVLVFGVAGTVSAADTDVSDEPGVSTVQCNSGSSVTEPISDDDGSASGSCAIARASPGPVGSQAVANSPPSVDAGPDKTVAPGSNVVLEGSVSDPDGDDVSYTWIQQSGPDITIRDKFTETAEFTAPSVSSRTTLTFLLSGNDGTTTSQDTVDVVVTPGGGGNSPPTAEAGPNVTVEAGASIELDATGSSDPDGDSLSYQWTQVSGPDAQIRGAGSSVAYALAPSVTGTATLGFEVTVDDGDASRTDRVFVTVDGGNVPPVADAGENRTVEPGETVTLRANGTDSDGQITSYTWSQLTGPDVPLDFDSPPLDLTFTAPEVPTTTTLRFQLNVTDDGSATDTDTVTITVVSDNEPPTADISVSPDTVRADQSFTASGSGSSDDGRIVRYDWRFGDGESASGETVSHTYNSAGSYTVTLTVEDDDGATNTTRKSLTVGQSPSFRVDSIDREIGGTVLGGIDLSENVSASVVSDSTVANVSFSLNGSTYTDTDGSDGWQQSIPVGDLSRSRVLTVTATTTDGRTASKTTTIPVVSTPGWLETVASVGSVTVDSEAAEVTVAEQIPDPPIDTSLTVPDVVPVISGPQEFEASSSFGVTYDMLDQLAEIRGEGMLYADVFDRSAEGELGAEGTVSTRDWEVQDGLAFVDLKVDAIGRSIEPSINTPIGDIGFEASVTVSPKIGLDVYFDNTDSGLQATRGSLEPGAEASALIQTEALSADVTGEVEGDLTGYAEVPAPYNPGGTASLVGEVNVERYPFSANFTFFNVTEGFGSQAGSAAVFQAADNTTVTVSAEDWTLVDKYGSVPTASGAGAQSAGIGVATEVSGSTDARLTRDRVADKSPALAYDASSDTSLAVWSRQNPEKTVAEGRDIYLATGNETGWSEPTALTDDRRMDTDPTLAVDGETGRAVAVWTRIDTVIPESNVSGPAAIANDTEIVYAVRANTDSAWSEPRELTNNSRSDRRPKLAYDGTTDSWQVAWVQDERTRLAQASDTDIESDDVFSTHASVDGSEAELSARPSGGFTFAYATGNDSEGTVVVESVDAESNRTEQRRLSVQSLDDISVAGTGVAWVEGSATEPVVRSLAAYDDSPRQIDVGNVSDIQDLTLASKNGTTVLTYRGQTLASPQKRVYYRVQRQGQWLGATPLTEGTATDLSYWQVSTALSDGGDRFRTAFLGRNVTADQNNDVFAVTHTLRPDLALTASAPNASVGSETTISYTVDNVGDIDIEDGVEVTVRADGEVVANDTIGGLDAGANATGTLSVTVPQSGTLSLSTSAPVTELTTRNNGETVGPATTDLTVTNVTSVRNGTNATVAFTIDNDGAATSQSVDYELRTNDTTILNGTLDAFAADTSQRVEQTLPAATVSANRTSEIVVDPDSSVVEADEGNNAWTGRLLAPDIVLWDGGVEYGNASSGVNVTVSLANEGASETPVTVTLYPESGSPVSQNLTVLGSNRPNSTVFETVRFSGVRLAANESVDVVARSPYERDQSDNAVESSVPASVAPESAMPVVPGQGAPATDLDGDGRLEDVTGDGRGSIFDAVAYYNNRNSAVITDNPALFDYDGDGTPGTIFDAVALYNEL